MESTLKGKEFTPVGVNSGPLRVDFNLEGLCRLEKSEHDVKSHKTCPFKNVQTHKCEPIFVIMWASYYYRTEGQGMLYLQWVRVRLLL